MSSEVENKTSQEALAAKIEAGWTAVPWYIEEPKSGL
jgi:hypothetical protein